MSRMQEGHFKRREAAVHTQPVSMSASDAVARTSATCHACLARTTSSFSAWSRPPVVFRSGNGSITSGDSGVGVENGPAASIAMCCISTPQVRSVNTPEKNVNGNI